MWLQIAKKCFQEAVSHFGSHLQMLLCLPSQTCSATYNPQSNIHAGKFLHTQSTIHYPYRQTYTIHNQLSIQANSYIDNPQSNIHAGKFLHTQSTIQYPYRKILALLNFILMKSLTGHFTSDLKDTFVLVASICAFRV